MKFTPLYDHVILKLLAAETTSQGGIVLTGNSAEPSSRAEVVAVGEGLLLSDGTISPLRVQVGDTVVFGQHSGMKPVVVEEEGDFFITRESNILAIESTSL